MKYSAMSAPAKLIQSIGSTAMCSTEPTMCFSLRSPNRVPQYAGTVTFATVADRHTRGTRIGRLWHRSANKYPCRSRKHMAAVCWTTTLRLRLRGTSPVSYLAAWG